MRTFTEFINEDVEWDELVDGGYKNKLEGKDIIEWLGKKFPFLNKEDLASIDQFYARLCQLSEHDNVALANPRPDTKALKIPRDMEAFIEDAIDTPTISGTNKFQFTPSTDKAGHGSIKYNNRTIFILGNGSADKDSLPKERHEVYTCMYYNANTKYFDELDAAIKVPKIWRITFHAHTNMLNTIEGFEPGKCRAVRVDAGQDYLNKYDEITPKLKGIKIRNDAADNEINRLYDRIETYWIKNLKSLNILGSKVRRDHFDKSDIILYDASRINDIKSIIEQTLNSKLDDASKALDILGLMQRLFAEHLMVGISLKELKKISGSFKPLRVNCGDDAIGTVTAFRVKSLVRKDNKVANDMSIEFDTKDPDNKNMVITARSFGSFAIDVTHKGHPALGKLPIELWRGWISKNSNVLPRDIKSIKDKDADKNPELIKDIVTKYYTELSKRFGWGLLDKNVELTIDANPGTLPALKTLYIISKFKDEDIKALLRSWAGACIAQSEDYGFPYIKTWEV